MDEPPLSEKIFKENRPIENLLWKIFKMLHDKSPTFTDDLSSTLRESWKRLVVFSLLKLMAGRNKADIKATEKDEKKKCDVFTSDSTFFLENFVIQYFSIIFCWKKLNY